MVGEIELHDGEPFLVVNTSGTLERLPKIGGWAILWLYIITRGGNMPIGWIRDYVRRHAAMRERGLIRRVNRWHGRKR